MKGRRKNNNLIFTQRNTFAKSLRNVHNNTIGITIFITITITMTIILK